MPSDKKMKRLEALLDTFDSGAVQPEELMQAIDAVVEIIKQSQDILDKKITDNAGQVGSELKNLTTGIVEANNAIQGMIADSENLSKKEIAEVRKLVAQEMARIEATIPQLPDEFDATELYEMLAGQKATLDGLSILVVGENIRNALESIPEEEDKLKIEAIGFLRKELDDLKKSIKQSNQGSGAIIARRLDQIGDTQIIQSDLNNRATLQYFTANNTWRAGHSVTVSATEPSDPKLFDLWFDIS